MFPTLPTLASSLSRAILLTTPAHSAPFKRSQNGLFHGKMKIYGNSVPFSKKKTRRWVSLSPSTLLVCEVLKGCCVIWMVWCGAVV